MRIAKWALAAILGLVLVAAGCLVVAIKYTEAILSHGVPPIVSAAEMGGRTKVARYPNQSKNGDFNASQGRTALMAAAGGGHLAW